MVSEFTNIFDKYLNLFAGPYIVFAEQSLYNTPHFNLDLDTTGSCCGCHFLTMEFYKGIIGN